MTSAKKGLQKFTESETKINQILKLDRITEKDIELLSKNEKLALQEIVGGKLNTFKDEELDALIDKIDEILPLTTKNQLWEHNHVKISLALSKLMQDYGIMPTKNQIAKETGLSRQTINKHIKDYASHPLYLKDIEQFRFLGNKVLAKVFKYAVNGDLKACRLYFDIIGGLNNQVKSSTDGIQQNNYIQINNTVLSQDELKELNVDQLNSIETVLKSVLSSNKINR